MAVHRLVVKVKFFDHSNSRMIYISEWSTFFIYSWPTGTYLPLPTTKKLLTGAFDKKMCPKTTKQHLFAKQIQAHKISEPERITPQYKIRT